MRAPGLSGSKREKRGEGRGPRGTLGCGVCWAGEGEVCRARGEKKLARGGWLGLPFFFFPFLFSFYFLFQKNIFQIEFCAQIISNQKQSSKT